MIVKDELNTLLQSDIQGYFLDCNYEVIDILQCLTYLRNNSFLREYEDVVNANIEAYNITCPIEFLDTDYIVKNDNDYLEVGNGFGMISEYLNTYMLEDCDGFEELLEENIIKVIE